MVIDIGHFHHSPSAETLNMINHLKACEFSLFFLYFRKTNMDTSQCSWTFRIDCIFSGNQRNIWAMAKIRFTLPVKLIRSLFLRQMDFRFPLWLPIDIRVHRVRVIVMRFKVDRLESFYRIKTFERTSKITKQPFDEKIKIFKS